MATEIEHKFLLTGDGWKAHIVRSEQYKQGYLANNDRCSVRVRIAGDQAWLNIKSATLGTCRSEFDYPVPADDAEQILETLCARPFIEKTRYFVAHAGHLWEIDVFAGDNEGLMVAEIELSSEGEDFVRPEWVGEDVSHDRRYYNSALVEHPYREWRGRQGTARK